MTTQWNVLSRLKQLVELDKEEAEKLLPVCVVNLQRILAMVNEDADKDDVRITEAAAALSFYDYAIKLKNEVDNITSFKAGDITVSQTSNSLTENAEKIKKDALLELTPLIKDTSFIFMNV